MRIWQPEAWKRSNPDRWVAIESNVMHLMKDHRCKNCGSDSFWVEEREPPGSFTLEKLQRLCEEGKPPTEKVMVCAMCKEVY